MARMLVWLVVLLLIAGGVYAAIQARYVYFNDGATQARQDRWTGDVQTWGCAAYEFRGAETAIAPLAPDAGDRPCTRYGWVTRK